MVCASGTMRGSAVSPAPTAGPNSNLPATNGAAYQRGGIVRATASQCGSNAAIGAADKTPQHGNLRGQQQGTDLSLRGCGSFRPRRGIPINIVGLDANAGVDVTACQP